MSYNTASSLSLNSETISYSFNTNDKKIVYNIFDWKVIADRELQSTWQV